MSKAAVEQRAAAELIRALAAFLYPPGAEHERLAGLLRLPSAPTAAEHSDLLLLQVHPYASVYLSEDGMKGGAVRDRADGFWRALGREAPKESDHLGALLGLLSALLEGAGNDDAEGRLHAHAAYALRAEFLDNWTEVFLDAVARTAQTPFHRAWGDLLRRGLAEARGLMSGTDEIGDLSPAPAPVDPAGVRSPEEHGIMGFVGDVLAPGRSGIVVTRREVERLASGEGMAFRAGTRASVLETLIRQAPAGTLGWLECVAGEWHALHLGRGDTLWAARADSTRELAAVLGASLESVS